MGLGLSKALAFVVMHVVMIMMVMLMTVMMVIMLTSIDFFVHQVRGGRRLGHFRRRDEVTACARATSYVIAIALFLVILISHNDVVLLITKFLKWNFSFVFVPAVIMLFEIRMSAKVL